MYKSTIKAGVQTRRINGASNRALECMDAEDRTNILITKVNLGILVQAVEFDGYAPADKQTNQSSKTKIARNSSNQWIFGKPKYPK